MKQSKLETARTMNRYLVVNFIIEVKRVVRFQKRAAQELFKAAKSLIELMLSICFCFFVLLLYPFFVYAMNVRINYLMRKRLDVLHDRANKYAPFWATHYEVNEWSRIPRYYIKPECNSNLELLELTPTGCVKPAYTGNLIPLRNVKWRYEK